jgi:sporulation protein YlmC with PRC-barrel domain
MPIFGEYETIEQISITEEPHHVTTVWKARKSGPPDGRLYAVKCYAPRPGRIITGQPEDARQLDRSLTFLEGIKRLKRAHTGGASCVAAVHAFGLASEGTWFVTDYYERGTLKEYIQLQGRMDSEALRQVVYRVITGCLAMQRSGGGKTHGNLKPSNMLLAGKPCSLRKTPLHLTDPYPAPRQLSALDTADQRSGGDVPGKATELQDLRAIGELILQLVEGRLLRNAYEYNYPVVRSEKWDPLGKAGESWRGLCNRLLDPKMSLEKETLENLERECRPPAVAAKLKVILAVLVAVCLAGVGLYYGVKALRASNEKTRIAWEQDYGSATNALAAGELGRRFAAVMDGARAAQGRRDYAESLKRLEEALRLKPSEAAAVKLKAEVEQQQTEAIAAADLDKRFAGAMDGARAAQGRRDYVESLKRLEEALRLKPNEAGAVKLRADVQAQLDLAAKGKGLVEEHYGSSHLASAPGYNAIRLSYIKRASQLIGKKVCSKGAFPSIGKLEDLALDLSTGKLVMALVSSGSDPLATPVPSGVFTSATTKESVLGVDKKTFSSVRRVPKANWTGGIDASTLGNMLRQFGQELSEATVSPAGFSSGASLIGRPLASQTGEPLGQLEDLMVDLPGGRLVFLVVKPVAGTDPDKCLYVLPPAAVRLNTNGGSLVLKASLEHFVTGPHFPMEYWTELVSPELAARVYLHYASREGGADTVDPRR